MLILLSPAKTFNDETKQSKKAFKSLNKANQLIKILSNKSEDELKNELKISSNLAKLAFNYYQNINFNTQAISLYGGEAFKHLKAFELSDKSLNKLYILSPLYGLINANDAISPYRLDIKDKILDISLYDYWYDEINYHLNELNPNLIINLASGEFARLLNKNNKKIYTINFGVLNDGKIKSHSMMLKKMRGLMTNYLLKNNIETIKQIKQIEIDGFTYNKDYSKKQLLMFIKEG